MTIIKDEERVSKLPAFVCVQDAKERNDKTILKYSEKQIAEARILLDKVQAAYFRSKVYLNYRDTFISVKVSSATYADKISDEVTELKEWATEQGYEIKLFGTHIIYHIHKE